MKHTHSLDVGVTGPKALPQWHQPGPPRPARWLGIAGLPVALVAAAAVGAIAFGSRVPVTKPLPVSVARVESAPPVMLPAYAESLPEATTASAKPAIMRVEAPPMIIEVTVKK